MQGKRFAAGLTAAAMAITPLAAPAVSGAAKSKVVAPKGKYKGATEQEGTIILNISKDRKYVKLVFFQLACDDQANGATGLQNLKLKKTKKGYTFGGSATSTVVYTDDTDADGTVAVVGRFSKNAKAVSGALRVKTDRCGDSGPVKFLATKK
jgi:hypothetical protein